MNTQSFTKRYCRLPRAEIGYLRFILESYEGLAFARTLDHHEALVEIACPASRLEDVLALLGQLVAEAGLQDVPPPDDVPPL